MEKYLKITLSDAPCLIPVKNILHIEIGSDTQVKVIYNTMGYLDSTVSQIIGLRLVATTADTTAKTKVQLTALADLIEQLLTMNWTKPVLDITSLLPYPITSIAQIEEEWSA